MSEDAVTPNGMSEDEALLRQTAEWLAEGAPVTWALVTRTWRSAPRPVGSLMVVASGGRFVGSVSGGCVESAVVQAAQRFGQQGQPPRLSFGVSQEQAWQAGLPCGGKIEVALCAVSANAVAHLLDRVRQRVAVRAALPVAAVAQDGHPLPGSGEENDGRPGLCVEDALPSSAARVEESQVVDDARRGAWFVRVFQPPQRLIVVGGVHLAQALLPMARAADFEVAVVDPRSAFASSARFPGTRILNQWPDEALVALRLDEHTAVAVLSHDAKLDDPALRAALDSPAFYIGALGSQRTQAARKQRLEDAGYGPERLKRIRGPIGLPIGAKTTAEIAISIMAEIVQFRRPTPTLAAVEVQTRTHECNPERASHV